MRRKKSGIDWSKCPRCGDLLKFSFHYDMTYCRSCGYIADKVGPQDTTPRDARGCHDIRLFEEREWLAKDKGFI